jgi:predicted HAD superfamily hydrolase
MLVSFDVFDTLVCRLVAGPVDVFKILEIEHGSNAPEGFSCLRIQAERIARSQTDKEDVTLSAIYAALQGLVPHHRLDLDLLMEAEIAAEVRLCVPRIDVGEKLKAYRQAGIPCIAISDMYLPQAAVERILEKCNIVLDKVYVSSEILLTKASGSLFDYVRLDRNVSFCDWHHHGDNFHSDVVSPTGKGISAFHTPIADFRLTTSANLTSDITNSIVTGVVRSLMYGRAHDDLASQTWYQTGAEYTGLLSLLLCQKAFSKAQENGAEKVHFLARDGYILKRIYDIMYPGSSHESVYLAASRRMVNFIQIAADNFDVKFLSANCEGLTGTELLERIGVTGRKEDTGLLAGTIRKQSDCLPILEKYRSEIIARAAQERGHVMNYLTQSGLLAETSSVLVDVGWFCSIQKSLASMMTQEQRGGRLHGVYFGTNVPKTSDLDAEGLFYTNKAPRARADAITKHIEVMELLFTAPEQSIVTVQRSEGDFEIIRMATTHESSRIAAAAMIGEGAMAFVEAVQAAGLLKHLTGPVSVDGALARFENLVRSPGRNISASVRAINHSVGFGGSRYEPFLRDCGSVRKPVHFLRLYVHSYWQEVLYRDFSKSQKLLASKPIIALLNLQWQLKQALPWRLRQQIKKIFSK